MKDTVIPPRILVAAARYDEIYLEKNAKRIDSDGRWLMFK